MNTETTTTTLPAAATLLGRIINPTGEPIDGRGPLVDVQARAESPAHSLGGSGPAMLETGIKPIDLLAPLVRGGVAGALSPVGVGKMVLLIELINTIASRHGGRVVVAGLEEHTVDVADLMRELRELGLERSAAMIFGRRDDAQAGPPQAALAALAVAEDFRARGHEVLLLLDKELALESGLDLTTARRGPGAAITTLIFGSDDPAPGQEQLVAALDAQIVFSRDLARQQIWPAVDPLRSRSRLLEQQLLDAEHVRVAAEARALLARAAPLPDRQGPCLVDLKTPSPAQPDDTLEIARARRAQLFLTQPFAIAELYTAIPGEHVPVERAIAGMAAILSGAHDATPEEELRFIGALG